MTSASNGVEKPKFALEILRDMARRRSRITVPVVIPARIHHHLHLVEESAPS